MAQLELCHATLDAKDTSVDRFADKSADSEGIKLNGFDRAVGVIRVAL